MYCYYEVLDSNSNRVCVCGSEADARMMVGLGDNRSWIKRQFLKPDTVSTTAEVIETKSLRDVKDLPESQAIPFNK